MKSVIILITSIICALNTYSQIWDYPPKAFDFRKEYGDFKMDSVKVFKVLLCIDPSHPDTSQYELKVQKEFDSLGRLVKLIEGEDTIYYQNHMNHFWTKGVKNGQPIQRTLKFDKHNNLTDFKNDKFEVKLIYDSLNRCIAKYSKNISHYWSYENELLKSYTIKDETEIVEKTTYYHDTINSFISYKTCDFSNIEGEQVEYCDSVFAKLNSLGKPTYIQNIELSERESDTITMTVEYDETGNVLGGTSGCQRIVYQYSEEGYRTLSRIYDCNNRLIHEEKYEYIFY